MQTNGVRFFPRHLKFDDLRSEAEVQWLLDGKDPESTPSELLLRQVMATHFKDIRLPLRGMWGICDAVRLCWLLSCSPHVLLVAAFSSLQCLKLGARRRRGGTEQERAQVAADQRLHRAAHAGERRLYETHRMMAEAEPHLYNSWIIDLTRSLYTPHRHPPFKVVLELGLAWLTSCCRALWARLKWSSAWARCWAFTGARCRASCSAGCHATARVAI